jgi:hypothetical protein
MLSLLFVSVCDVRGREEPKRQRAQRSELSGRPKRTASAIVGYGSIAFQRAYYRQAEAHRIPYGRNQIVRVRAEDMPTEYFAIRIRPVTRS